MSTIKTKWTFKPTDIQGVLTLPVKLGFTHLLNPSGYGDKEASYSAMLLFEKKNKAHVKALEHITAYARFCFETVLESKKKAKELEEVALNPANVYSLIQDCDKKSANVTASAHAEKMAKYPFLVGCHKLTPKNKRKPAVVNADNEPIHTVDWFGYGQPVRADLSFWCTDSGSYGCNLIGLQVLTNKPTDISQESRFTPVEVEDEEDFADDKPF